MSDGTLFDLPRSATAPQPVVKLSPDKRRGQLQAERMARGLHPLAGLIGGHLRLHPDAPPFDDRTAPGPRCGSCWYRELWGHGNRSFAKCMASDGIRATHSAASDVRAWWPGCVDYSAGDPSLSPDAARHIPEEGA